MAFITAISEIVCMPCFIFQQSMLYQLISYSNVWYLYFPRFYFFPIFKNVGLKTLLREGLSESEFNGDLVYKFKRFI